MDLRTWQTLAEPMHEQLVQAAADIDAANVAAVERLRKLSPDVELVRTALMLAEARRKAVPKFGAERAAKLWADPQVVEMATSALVARHKADRFGQSIPRMPMADLCCGIGGDAMELARGNDVLAVDNDSVRAWMTGLNAGCRTLVGDAERVEFTQGPVHIDPARRDEHGGGRLWRLEDLRPSIDVVRGIVRRAKFGAAVKLGPGADLAALDRALPGSQIEIISENGTLVQCVVWWEAGILNRYEPEHSARIATMLRGSPDETKEACDSRRVSLVGMPDKAIPVEPDGRALRFVYEADDSVERASLLARLCEETEATMLHPHTGLLTSDTRRVSPWLTAFEVLDQLPWHENRVKHALDAYGAGIVEVKTRGKAVDPDVVQKALRGRGDQTLTVFVLRFDRALRAIIAGRVR
jgi:hypothetical protein